MTKESITALQTSLVELSKAGTIHFETTATQLAHTRLAILQAEGVDLEKYTEYMPKIKEIERLNAQIKTLRETRERLIVENTKLQIQKYLQETEDQTETDQAETETTNS